MDLLRNLEAEMSVLGAVLIEPAEVCRIKPEEFFDRRHQVIAEVLIGLAGRGVAIDLVTVSAELSRHRQLEEAGGSGYVMELLNYCPTATNIEFYNKLVREAFLRRRLAEKGREISEAARTAESTTEALDLAEVAIMALRDASSPGSGPTDVSKLLVPALNELERLHQRGGAVTGVPTGFFELDRMTCGLQSGDLIIIAGRPSMGKTALGLNFAENAAANGHRTFVVSLEMGKEQLVSRLIASTGRINAQRMRSGNLGDTEWEETFKAAEKLRSTPLLISDDPLQTVFDIRSASRRVMRNGGLDMVVIDYLQLMRPVKNFPTREREVAEMSRSLKSLAKELRVPVVVLAQLNRTSEGGGTPRRPVMSDLRESGSLEQDADLILFPWRESAFCPKCREISGDCGEGHFRKAEIIIGKQRNGPTGTIKVAWLPELCRFEEIEMRR